MAKTPTELSTATNAARALPHQLFRIFASVGRDVAGKTEAGVLGTAFAQRAEEIEALTLSQPIAVLKTYGHDHTETGATVLKDAVALQTDLERLQGALTSSSEVLRSFLGSPAQMKVESGKVLASFAAPMVSSAALRATLESLAPSDGLEASTGQEL